MKCIALLYAALCIKDQRRLTGNGGRNLIKTAEMVIRGSFPFKSMTKSNTAKGSWRRTRIQAGFVLNVLQAGLCLCKNTTSSNREMIHSGKQLPDYIWPKYEKAQ